jgi:predicted membrane protein
MAHEPGHEPGKTDRSDRLISVRFLIGVWIIANGLILLAGNLGWIEARPLLRHLWPLIFVFLGIGMLSQTDRRNGRQSGWVFVIVGLWLFADKLDWIGISVWNLLFPGVLLFIGFMLVKRAFHSPKTVSMTGEDHAEYVRSFAVMSGSELRPVSRPFRGADLNAVMAGIKLDLTDARMEGDIATIEVFAFWGGMEIHVPPDWTVTSKVTSFMGGFIDKRRPTVTVPTRTLVIDGVIVMSGIEIKN